ncbi:MAG TPA: hypothetical protein VK157_07920 [Phycisphaerales bacterium]|nr:hypothetical protein [Phycisphaerales bacterium]
MRGLLLCVFLVATGLLGGCRHTWRLTVENTTDRRVAVMYLPPVHVASVGYPSYVGRVNATVVEPGATVVLTRDNSRRCEHTFLSHVLYVAPCDDVAAMYEVRDMPLGGRVFIRREEERFSFATEGGGRGVRAVLVPRGDARGELMRVDLDSLCRVQP